MDHARANELFSAYAEGQLGAEDAKALDEHLKSCESCRADYEVFQRTMVALSGLAATDAPPDFVASVRDQVRKRSRGRFFGSRRMTDRIPFETLSVVMLIVLLCLYLVLHAMQPGTILLQ